jgi:hypothetical protein
MNTNYGLLREKTASFAFCGDKACNVSNGFSSISERTTGAHDTGCDLLN